MSFQKIIAIVIKHRLKRKNGKSYSFSCTNSIYNTQKSKEIMKNKVIKEKSGCFNYNHKNQLF